MTVANKVNKVFIHLFGTILITFFSSAILAAATGTLTVSVTNLKSDQGVVRIALFDSEQAYKAAGLGDKGAYKHAAVSIKNGQSVWSVSDLPYGDYAIKLFHDVDNSGQLKTNFFGIPKEGYGFSNNPNVTGIPTYEQAKFSLDKKKQSIAIKIIN